MIDYTEVDRNYVASTGDIPEGMKLLSDTVPLQVLDVNENVISEANGQKGLPVMRITGIFQRSDKKNANGRVYPRDVLETDVRSIQEDIKSRRVMGELDHPVDAKIHTDRVSHLVTRLWMEGDVVYGESEILHKLPCGEMLKGLFEHRVQMGISSRGIGDMEVKEENGEETYIVQEGYRFVTWDAVAEPSVPGGTLMVMESRQKKVRQAAAEAKRQHEKMLVEEIRKRFSL
jgi:hypothetical protein